MSLRIKILLKHTADSQQAETGVPLAASWVVDSVHDNFYVERMLSIVRNQFLTARTKLMENTDNVVHVKEATRHNDGIAPGYTHVPASFTEDWVVVAVPARASYEQATRDTRLRRFAHAIRIAMLPASRFSGCPPALV